MEETGDRLKAEVLALGRSVGLDAVGVTGADPFPEVRAELERRRAEGLHGGMQFTFRNPARSTDPGRILEGARSLVVGALRTPAPRLAEVGAGRLRIAAYARHDHYATPRGHPDRLAGRIRADEATRICLLTNLHPVSVPVP